MKPVLVIRIILLFMIVVIAGFDRHLAWYFPCDVTAMIQNDTFPSHSDLPVKASDHHEDITIKTIFSAIPSPREVQMQNYRFFHFSIPRISPHTVWQPPEYKA